MSRVHDALRRSDQGAVAPSVASPSPGGIQGRNTAPVSALQLDGLLEKLEQVPFDPLPDSHLLKLTGDRASDGPVEEFRTLRTRVNHLQTLQPIHTVVVTSPSPAEGKSFTAANFAVAEAQLADNPTLLADFDFRRPIVHSFFGLERTPGVTDYLQGKAELHEIIRKVEGMELYIMPAGEPVMNPLELLNLAAARRLLEQLPRLFNWVIMDTPPLLFAADANLLSTLCHGTLLVVRIGSTTIDSVTRAMQSLCENNVLGIVVNGARRGELYSKYTYYHSYYYKSEAEEVLEDEEDDEDE
jgi:protein-tyrosine kinase